MIILFIVTYIAAAFLSFVLMIESNGILEINWQGYTFCAIGSILWPIVLLGLLYYTTIDYIKFR